MTKNRDALAATERSARFKKPVVPVAGFLDARVEPGSTIAQVAGWSKSQTTHGFLKLLGLRRSWTVREHERQGK